MERVETHGLTKDYGSSHGIFDLDLTIHEGEIFGLVGPNGAGKTTTIRLLMNLIRATRGSATVLGMDAVRDSVKIKQETGFMPAEAPDYPNQTGAQIIGLLANVRGSVIDSRITELASQFDLDLSRKYHEYSHGNRQKLWLLQSVMHNPKLVFLDEPTSGLDPVIQQRFRELMRTMRERGTTIVLSSHVLPEVQELCDRVGVVHGGKLRQVGTMDELRIGRSHRVAIQCGETVDRSTLEHIPGLSDLYVEDHRITCTIAGAMTPLLDAVRPATILTIDSAEMSLEEIFLTEFGNSK